MVSSYKLAELWQRLGYRVVVACMGESTRTEVVSETLTIHFRKDLFLKDPFNFGIAFGFAGFVRRLIKDVKPDLIVVNKVLFWTSFATIPLALTGHKILLLTDALVGMTWWPRTWFPKVVMACGAWTVGWLVLLSAKRIVTFHPQPQSILRRLGIAKKTEVIPTGIDPAPYSATVSGQRSVVRPEVTVTYVGRLESVKGVDDFLAAAVTVKKSHPELKIQVVGNQIHPNQIFDKYRKEGMIEFPGYKEDIPAILNGTDIFVLPSYSEGLSNALMEAMASGCACLATDVGGNRFLIQNGVSGLLFPPGDREALAAHLRRVLDDPAKRKSMGEAARKRIEAEFSWEIVGNKYKTLFTELLSLSLHP